MTPSLTFILSVALFWTLPASAAVLAYRSYGSSIEKLTSSITSSVGSVPSPVRTQRAKALDA